MRKRQVSFWVVCCMAVGLPLLGFAQKDTERRYRAGVKAVQVGEYDRARADLQVVMKRDGSFTPYAYYYYAIASARQKRFDAARTTLKQLIDRYPNWQKREEAYYLAASAAFEQNLFDEAFTYTNLLSDPILRREADRMEAFFLPRISDLSRLKALQKQYPNDRVLAQNLVELIQRTSSEKTDLELSDRLSNRFGIAPVTAPSPRPTPPPVSAPSSTSPTPAAPTANVAGRQRNKGYFNVGVLLPFRLKRFVPGDLARSNRYVFDLYEGMKLAKNKLMAEGITVNLFAYDSENSTDETLDLVNNASFAQNDLLIGPIYSEPNKLVSAFALQNGIPLVNPIATSHDLIADLPNAYLAQPSTLQQAAATVQFVKGITDSKKAAVYFGASRKDSLLAAAYQAELRGQGYQVVDFRKLTGSSTSMAAAIRVSDLTRPGHVFFSSSNDDDGSSLLSALSNRGISGPLIATYPAFDYFRNSLSTFTRRELYLVAPEFMDLSREATDNFQETYLSRRYIIPSVFAAWGYDMMLFFGRQLARNTLKNRSSLRTEPDEDYVLSGFDYTQSNDNQTVPIIKFDGSRFVRVN